VATPLETVRGSGQDFTRNVGGYFMEEVRRDLIQRYGESADPQHPNSLYAGGLWVRTSYNPVMQQSAETALRDGLARYETGRGWRDPGLNIDIRGDWRSQLAVAPLGQGYPTWRAAVVLAKDGGAATLGFVDGTTGPDARLLASMPRRNTGGSAFDALHPGAVIAVEQQGDAWALRNIPEISGGMVVEEVGSGRVLAMQGGWDVRGSNFTRATQAMRQPGSTFKAIVYSAALDNGMTPASIIIDGPFCANQGTPSQKCFRNFGGAAGSGPHTMRWGIEQSRNLMTVRTANQIGMNNVVRRARQMGVGDYPPFLAIALGAGDTTVSRMVNAFSTFANQGRALNQSLIDYIQDRGGPRHLARRYPALRRLQRAGLERPADAAAALAHPPGRRSDDRLPDRPHPRRRRPARHRHDIARSRPALVRQDRHHLGPDQRLVRRRVAAGRRRRLYGLRSAAADGRLCPGRHARRADLPPVRADRVRRHAGPAVPRAAGHSHGADRRASGQRVFGIWPNDNDPHAAVIWEAFKPESEPRRTTGHDAIDLAAVRQARPTAPTADRQRDSEFLQRQGGIY